MIVVDENPQNPDFKSKQHLLREPSSSSSVPLDDLPPSFEESTAPPDVFSGPYTAAPSPPFQEPPPDFAPYIASCFTQSDGSLISHDAHLNEDGK